MSQELEKVIEAFSTRVNNELGSRVHQCDLDNFDSFMECVVKNNDALMEASQQFAGTLMWSDFKLKECLKNNGDHKVCAANQLDLLKRRADQFASEFSR
jgi:hypothetical protein